MRIDFHSKLPFSSSSFEFVKRNPVTIIALAAIAATLTYASFKLGKYLYQRLIKHSPSSKTQEEQKVDELSKKSLHSEESEKSEKKVIEPEKPAPIPKEETKKAAKEFLKAFSLNVKIGQEGKTVIDSSSFIRINKEFNDAVDNPNACSITGSGIYAALISKTIPYIQRMKDWLELIDLVKKPGENGEPTYTDFCNSLPKDNQVKPSEQSTDMKIRNNLRKTINNRDFETFATLPERGRAKIAANFKDLLVHFSNGDVKKFNHGIKEVNASVNQTFKDLITFQDILVPMMAKKSTKTTKFRLSTPKETRRQILLRELLSTIAFIREQYESLKTITENLEKAINNDLEASIAAFNQ